MKTVAVVVLLAIAACGSSLDDADRRRLAETAANAADPLYIYKQLTTIEDHPSGGIVSGSRASFLVDATDRVESGERHYAGAGSMVDLGAAMTLTVDLAGWSAEPALFDDEADAILLDGQLMLVQTMTFDHATDPWPDATLSRVTGRLTASGAITGTYDVTLDICRTDWFPLAFFGPSTWGYHGTVGGDAIDNRYIDNTPTCTPSVR